MKKDIHPTYYPEAKVTCACGNVIAAGSTKKELRTEICSACHPFYTGKQKLVDTAGRVDKFRAKMIKAKEIKESEKERKTKSKKEGEEFKTKKTASKKKVGTKRKAAAKEKV